MFTRRHHHAPLLCAAAATLLGGSALAEADRLHQAVQAQLEQALVVPGRVELVSLQVDAPGCKAHTATSPAIDGSRRVAVKLEGRTTAGRHCDGWAWATVRVSAKAYVLTRAVRTGEPLEGATQHVEREVRPGRPPLAVIAEGAIAAQPLRAGVALEPQHLARANTLPGQPIAVLVRFGTLTVEQPGRVVPCGGGRVCAALPSGKRVEGRLQEGALLVEAP